MFDLKKETIKIKDASGNESTYEVSPLTGEYLEDFYYVLDKLQSVSGDDKGALGEEKKDNTEILKMLGTDVSKKLHRLVYASLAQSYPDVAKDGKKLDHFVSQNLLTFLPAVVKVNMPSSQ